MRVLDIGTGSGLIALMLAQRLEQEKRKFSICGIDIESNAVEQSRINYE
jgi:tRNA1Val (adenine37-N6)-methyltransferase